MICRKCATLQVRASTNLETASCSKHLIWQLLPTQVCRALGGGEIWRWEPGKGSGGSFSIDTPDQQAKCNNWRHWQSREGHCFSWPFCYRKHLWSRWTTWNFCWKTRWSNSITSLLFHFLSTCIFLSLSIPFWPFVVVFCMHWKRLISVWIPNTLMYYQRTDGSFMFHIRIAVISWQDFDQTLLRIHSLFTAIQSSRICPYSGRISGSQHILSNEDYCLYLLCSITNMYLRLHMLWRGHTILQRQQLRAAQLSCLWPVQMTNNGRHPRKHYKLFLILLNCNILYQTSWVNYLCIFMVILL